MNLYQKREEFKPDNLLNDISVPTIEKYVKIKKSATPTLRGTVLAVGTDGYAVAVDSAKEGVKEPKYVLAYDVDSSTADAGAVAFSTGLFNRKALIFGGADDASKHEEALRALGIHMKDNI